MSARAGARTRLVLTCEHADHRVPRRYAALFAGAEDVLASHRGWDPGAWRLGRLIAKRLARPLRVTRWSRLLVESNRSPTNPAIWSGFSKVLPREERADVLARYWWPHREEVAAAVAGPIGRGERVLHVAVHSFTPVMDGEARNADVAFLFDSARSRERKFAERWSALLRERAPGLRVRFNYPYRGATDGLATWLRRRHPESRYRGFELEVNQALSAGPGWRAVGEALAASLAAALRGDGLTPRPPRRSAGSGRRSPRRRARRSR